MSVMASPFTGTFVADPVHSSLRFTVTHWRVATFSATFDDFSATVVGGDEGITVEGSAAVESVSIRAPKEFRDHVVFGRDFFDARRQPRMTFRAGDVRLDDDGLLSVNGELTIKGITRPFTAGGRWRPPVEIGGAVRAGVDIVATIDRRDWNIGMPPNPGSPDPVGHEVTVTAHLELVRS